MNNYSKNAPESTSQLPNQAVEMAPGGNSFRVLTLFLASHGVAHALFIYLALRSGSWQLWVIVGLIFLLELVTVGGMRLVRSGRAELGVELSLGAWLGVLLAISVLIAGLGLPLSLITVIIVLAVAGQSLSQKSAGRMIMSSIGVGFVIVLLDLFGLGFRLPVPDMFVTAILVVAGLLTLIYGYFIIRQFPHYALRTKLVVLFVAVGILSVAIMAVSTNLIMRSTLMDNANQSLFVAASQTADELDGFFQTNLSTVQVEAKMPGVIEYLSLPAEQRTADQAGEQLITVLDVFRSKSPFITSYALLDRQGVNVLDTDPASINRDESDTDYFRKTIQTDAAYVSDIRFSPELDHFSIYFSSPVHRVDGMIIGVLRVRYNVQVLQELVSQSTGLVGPESFAMVLDEDYIRVAHGTAPDLNLKSVVPLDSDRIAELLAIGRLPNWPPEALSTNLPDFAAGLARVDTAEPFFAAEVHSGESHLEQVAVTRLQTKPWLVTFSMPQDVFLAPVKTQTQVAVLTAVVVVIVVAGVAFGLGHLLARPIMHLTEVARQVAGGTLEVQAPVKTRDESGQLAAAFNMMTAQLRNLIGSLEDQVRERTLELTLSMKVGQRAAAIRDLSELLPIITEFIREQFDLYYTQVYLLDDPGQNLVLKAGSGSVGAELLERRHSLPVGYHSIVGRVAAEGQAIVVSDTEASDIHRPNPLLPDTRCELAVPLIVEEQVIGVLDMQADQVNTFTEDNLPVFEAMATQLAVSIDSAKQWALAQESQQKTEEAMRQATRESWAERLASYRTGLGFAYDLSSVRPVEAEAQNGGISVPVMVQNEPIGQLMVELTPDSAWSEDEQALLTAVSQQLAQRAENLRLFEQTQQRAVREQIARRIIDKVRASRDMESALKTAAEELTRTLGVARAVVDLRVAATEQPSEQDPSNESGRVAE